MSLRDRLGALSGLVRRGAGKPAANGPAGSGVGRPATRQALASTTSTPRLDLACLAVMLLLAAASWWPIYHTPWMWVSAVVGLLLGGGIGLLSARAGWPGSSAAGALAAVYLLAAVPASAPQVLRGQVPLGRGLLGVLVAPVAGPKNLLTLDLPVGAYQELLTFFFFLVLVAAFGVVRLSRGLRVRWWAAALVPWALAAAGVALGPRRVDDGLVWGATSDVRASTLAILALAGVGMLWTGWRWRVTRSRVAAANPAEFAAGSADAQAGGAVVPSSASGSSLLRVGAAALVLAVAVASSLVVTPLSLRGRESITLRAGVDPAQAAADQVSPLVGLREYTADDLLHEPLFEVTGAGELDRVRVATLAEYDGQTFEAAGADGGGVFTRMPALTGGAGGPGEERVQIQVLHSGQFWVPLVGHVSGVEFSGPRRAAYTEGFYYNAQADTGIELAHGGLSEGAIYTADASPYLLPASAVADFSHADAPGLLPSGEVPPSLVEWIDAQQVGNDGASLLTLVQRLRQRGYLSHGLLADEPGRANWQAALPDYVFESSRPGHSLWRIDDMFTRLLERQREGGPEEDAALVAAPGDEEQFAAAAALIAKQLGFRARVVVGAHLTPADRLAAPACEDGVCKGENMTAWLEVANGDSDEWAAIDVRPQFEDPIAPPVQETSDPKIMTQVDPRFPQMLAPPEPNPSVADPVDSEPPADSSVSSTLLRGLRVAGIVALSLFLLLGPAAMIAGAKRWRRRVRRNLPTTETQVLAGWEEYLDLARDHGWPLRDGATRRETAAELAKRTPSVEYLAYVADQATFTNEGIVPQASETYWKVVDQAREEGSGALPWVRRMRAKLSLQSLRVGQAATPPRIPPPSSDAIGLGNVARGAAGATASAKAAKGGRWRLRNTRAQGDEAQGTNAHGNGARGTKVGGGSAAEQQPQPGSGQSVTGDQYPGPQPGQQGRTNQAPGQYGPWPQG